MNSLILEWAVDGVLSYDQAFFFLVQKTLRHPFLDYLMPWVSEPSTWIAPVGVFLVYLFVRDRRRAALFVLSAIFLVTLADGSATALKGLFLRPRPTQVGIDRKVLVQRPARSSFPSNHAANAFALAALITVYYPTMAGITFAAAALVGLSRIYLRSHYPLDVVFGALLGIILAAAVALATRSLRERLCRTPIRGHPPNVDR